ncbi:MAG TPA: sensor histidine kinase [Chroococcales cyanobacterium]|jgi:signal transduction histidine kinase
MTQSLQIRNHPFRFLLYLEWILLIVAALSVVSPLPFRRLPQLPLLAILSVAGFGLMGLRIPTGKLFYRLVYTSVEFFLVSLTVVAGGIRLFPFLYIVIVIRSCLIFRLPGRLAITGISFTLFLLTLLRWSQSFPVRPWMQERLRFIVLGYALLFGLSLAFVLLLMNALLSERQSRDKLTLANEQLRKYALRIEDQATLQERNRIARDIHDSLGHSLTALNLQLETALKLWSANPDKAAQFLMQAKRLGSTALQDVRQSVSTMRSEPWQERSLEAAIASLVEGFEQSNAIAPICSIILDRAIPADISISVYRIVQEALTNISKYASATEVKIQLQATTTELYLLVQDNGKGFNLDENRTGFGLQGMRERTFALDGQLAIDSAPGAGCRITAKFPLPRL